jgi:hypothetical protein
MHYNDGSDAVTPDNLSPAIRGIIVDVREV